MADMRATPRGPRAGTVTEESLMLDHLRRIERQRNGCCAVHFHLSRLQAPNRKPRFIRIAARSFDTLVANQDATLYVLANSDMALICRDVRVEDIDTAAFRLRALFDEDPVTAETGEDRFATWYDLADSVDFGAFEELALRLEAEAERLRQAPIEKDDERIPLDAGTLGEVEQRLRALRVGDLLNSQPAVDVGTRRILFREHFVSMAALERRAAPDVDLSANPWLFNYITEFLDRRMLAVIGASDFGGLAEPISLNLHVGTVLSPDFQVFHDRIRPHAERLIVEFQMIDVIADMGTFNYAKNWLRQHGYRILIDGLNPLALQYFDPGVLEPDFVKIAWSSDLAADIPENRLVELRDLIDYTGADRIVLSRAEKEAAIGWGLSLGIHRFQGFFVDKLVDAMAAKGLV